MMPCQTQILECSCIAYPAAVSHNAYVNFDTCNMFCTTPKVHLSAGALQAMLSCARYERGRDFSLCATVLWRTSIFKGMPAKLQDSESCSQVSAHLTVHCRIQASVLVR